MCSEMTRNPGQAWKKVNHILGRRTRKSIYCLRYGDEVITDRRRLAECFRDSFSFATPSLPSDTACILDKSPTKLRFAAIEEESVLKILSTLDIKKATGCDMISARLLKAAAPAIAKSLTLLFNESLNSGKFPSEWKMALVTPVPKSGDKQLVSNYRPISVLPAIAKVFERLVHQQLYNYLASHNLLNEAQSGFRPQHSTQDVLLKTVDDWKKVLDENGILGTVLIDLSKAFDSIDHSLLMKKLQAYGVEDVEHRWFADYLSARKQRVTIDGVVSEWSSVIKGVPQGSILGPLLFNIFVNDLPDVVKHSSINLYADDATIYVSDRDPATVSMRLSEDLARILQWIEANGMRMNIAKTQLMVLSRKSRRTHANSVRVKLEDEEICPQQSVKYLGVTIDQDLSWSQHVEIVRKKSLAGLSAVRRASAYLPTATRRLLYNALVLPHLDYCSVVYHSCNISNSNKLERVQNYAMRVILKKPPRTPSEPLRDALGWTTLQLRRQNRLLCQVYRCLHGHAPMYLRRKFITNADFGYQTTRAAGKLHLPRPLTNHFKSSFEFQGALAYNALPVSITSASSSVSFRSKLFIYCTNTVL